MIASLFWLQNQDTRAATLVNMQLPKSSYLSDRDCEDREWLAVTATPGLVFGWRQSYSDFATEPKAEGESMSTQAMKLAVVVTGLAAIVVMGLVPARATAQNHPQEVLDLIAAHEALAMKIRPLQDRVLTATVPRDDNSKFNPDGVPVRAKGAATSGSNSPGSDLRAAERLRHKDRAASDGDDYGRIKVRLSALEKKARAERERVMRPHFGVGLAQRDSESGEIRFGDGRVGSRPPTGTANNAGAKEIAGARKALGVLQRELAVLEREVNAL